MLLLVLSLSFLAFYSFLYLRLVPDKVMTTWFAISITLGFMWLFAASYPLYIAQAFLGLIEKKAMHKYSTMLGNAMLWGVRGVNPQLRVHGDYSRGVTWTDVPPNAHVLFNHMSFWDSLNYSAEVPFSVAWTKKTLMKASLSKMPIAGTLFFKILGHFPVHFSSEAADSFVVDREKQEAVSKDIDSWLGKENKGLGYCPEGRMGTDPAVVQPLRYGMLKVVAASGHPVFVCTQWQNEVFWPIGESFGGHAADVGITIAEYKYKDGKEPVPKVDETGEVDIGAYATDMQQFMQREVDRLRKNMDDKKLTAVRPAKEGKTVEGKKKI